MKKHIHHHDRQGHTAAISSIQDDSKPISGGYDGLSGEEQNSNNSNQQPIKDNDSDKEELSEPLPQDVTDEPAVLVEPTPAAPT